MKEQLFDAEEDAWEASAEGRAERARAVQLLADAEAERVRRERVWAARYPDEWDEWIRLLPLLRPYIDFSNAGEFTFDDFLREVGRRPSANHIVVRRDETLPYEQGNMVWEAPKAEPPKSPFLNAEEAAARLGISLQTLYNNSKHIPRLPGFRNLMYDPRVLDQIRADARFLSKRRRSSR